jgi:hypothetical protein
MPRGSVRLLHFKGFEGSCENENWRSDFSLARGSAKVWHALKGDEF